KKAAVNLTISRAFLFRALKIDIGATTQPQARKWTSWQTKIAFGGQGQISARFYFSKIIRLRILIMCGWIQGLVASPKTKFMLSRRQKRLSLVVSIWQPIQVIWSLILRVVPARQLECPSNGGAGGSPLIRPACRLRSRASGC